MLIPTFGFYRFWMLTNLRRHLWANTRLGDETLEYTGTGKELLIGFLIAMAVLLPVVLGISFLSMAGPIGTALSFVLMFGLIVLGYYAVFAARRYLLTRTVFRGIRFWVQPAGWGYAWRSLGWMLLSALSLGICIPWATAALERYLMQNTQYGDLQGNFSGKGSELFKRLAWIYAVPVVAMVLAFMLSGGSSGTSPVHVILVILYLAILFLFPYVQAVVLQWKLSHVHFGQLSLVSYLRAGQIYGLWLKYIGSNLLFVVLIGAVFLLLMGVVMLFGGLDRPIMDRTQVGFTEVFFIVCMALVYAAILLGMTALARYFFHRGLWVEIVKTLTVVNLEELDRAKASGYAADKLGAGLADALNVELAF